MSCSTSCASSCKHLTCAAKLLVNIGAINWGLIGIFNFNLVNAIFGGIPLLEKAVYIIVGLAGVLMLAKCCMKKCPCTDGKCDTGACKVGDHEHKEGGGCC